MRKPRKKSGKEKSDIERLMAIFNKPEGGKAE
jgi:hypothetical protein